MEEERRRNAVLERRRREEAARRREMEELYRQRGEMEQLSQRRRNANGDPPGRHCTLGSEGSYQRSKPYYQIMRGQDGRLYRVLVEPSLRNEKHDDIMDTDSETGSVAEDEVFYECRDNEDESSVVTGVDTPATKQRWVPLQTIPVENVPDEEDDELREMKSVFRNRRPSPGQWLEPVEKYYIDGIGRGK